MAVAPRHLVDTNILLRISRHADPQHTLIAASLKELERQGAELCYAPQNIAEFWNVCTRPISHNGYGLATAETNMRVKSIEHTMTLLPDSEQVYSIRRKLIVDLKVQGVQVHDARLAATMQAFGVTHILTLNRQDFLRYVNLTAIHPSQLASVSG